MHQRGAGGEGLEFKVPGSAHCWGPEHILHHQESPSETVLPETQQASTETADHFLPLHNILTYCCTVWYSCWTAVDRKDLQRVVKTAERIVGSPLPNPSDIHSSSLLTQATNILQDPSPSGNPHFSTLHCVSLCCEKPPPPHKLVLDWYMCLCRTINLGFELQWTELRENRK